MAFTVHNGDTFNRITNSSLDLHDPTGGDAHVDAEWKIEWKTGSIFGLVIATSDYCQASSNEDNDGFGYELAPTPTDADIHVKFKFKVEKTGTSTTHPNNWCFRYQDASNFYMFRILPDGGSNNFQLWKRISDTYTKIAEVSQAITNQDIVEFKIEGDAITITYDGTDIITETDSAISAAGKVIWSLGNAPGETTLDITTLWRIDDIVLETQASSTPVSNTVTAGIEGMQEIESSLITYLESVQGLAVGRQSILDSVGMVDVTRQSSFDSAVQVLNQRFSQIESMSGLLSTLAIDIESVGGVLSTQSSMMDSAAKLAVTLNVSFESAQSIIQSLFAFEESAGGITSPIQVWIESSGAALVESLLTAQIDIVQGLASERLAHIESGSGTIVAERFTHIESVTGINAELANYIDSEMKVASQILVNFESGIGTVSSSIAFLESMAKIQASLNAFIEQRPDISGIELVVKDGKLLMEVRKNSLLMDVREKKLTIN